MFQARLAHTIYKFPALTRDLMAPATLLLLATFILPHLYLLHPKHIPNIWIWIQALNEPHLPEPHALITPLHSLPSPFSYLHWLSVLSFFTPQQTLPPLPPSPPTHHTEPNHLHTRGQVISILFCPSHPHFLLFHHCIHVYFKSQRGLMQPYLTPLSIRNHSLTPPFTLTQAKLSTYILHPLVYSQYHTFSTPATKLPY